jgi:MFS family permease
MTATSNKPFSATTDHRASRLPFFYGWVIVAIAFVTMAIAVTARTSFSLLLPPLIDEFGWDRSLVAGAFSFGFLIAAFLGPISGRLMDKRGPGFVIECGVCLTGVGLILAAEITQSWQLYATLGVMVGGGASLMTYVAQSQYLPNWFVRRRALAISIAFAGAGVGAIILLPWMELIIARGGWRASCWALGLLVLVVLFPLNLLVRRTPEDVGLLPDGELHAARTERENRTSNVVDTAWVATDWTLARAIRTSRFWWIALGYFCALFAWYAVQVHQTKYLIECGFTPTVAAWSLGLVSVVAIPGQIGLGALSDRVGREWIWVVACGGFAICYAVLIAMEHTPSYPLLYLMVISQGLLGYSLTSVMGPIVAEVFEGPHYGSIFGVISVAMVTGGAAGPWTAGLIHDTTGSYRLAFLIAFVLCAISAIAIWMAAPRKVRMVSGRMPAQLPAG